MILQKKLYLVALGLIYSASIGIFSFLFLQVEHGLIHLVWEVLPRLSGKAYPVVLFLLLCAGAICLSGLSQRFGSVPYTAKEIRKAITFEGQHKRYQVGINSLAALLVLALGAGVGPEAPLLAVIVALSIFQVDKMRYVNHHYEQWLHLPLSRKVMWLVDTQAESLSDLPITEQVKLKKGFQLLFILNGFLTFLVLSVSVSQGSSNRFFGAAAWHLSDLVYLPLALLLPVIVGLVYLMSEARLHHLSLGEGVEKRKSLIGAVAIFMVYLYNENLLFSGQSVVSTLAEKGLNLSLPDLILAMIVKLALLLICIRFGWKGGDIFPLLFTGALQGFILSHLFPEGNHLVFLAVAIASFLTITVGQVAVIILFTALFFPMTYLPIIVLATVLTLMLRKGLEKVDYFRHFLLHD